MKRTDDGGLGCLLTLGCSGVFWVATVWLLGRLLGTW